jgi:methylated-DNA-[protein]-cysteine S-methyltransferase
MAIQSGSMPVDAPCSTLGRIRHMTSDSQTSDRSIRYTTLDSPLGDLLLVGHRQALSGIAFLSHAPAASMLSSHWLRDDDAFAAVARQLRAYFAGELRSFELPLAPRGTPFQQRVWTALADIPYGSTRTYGQLAQQLGQPLAARAVGLANARNPIPIVIPCHRLVGADGALVGYGGGLANKRWLLALEGSANEVPR